MWLSSCWIGRYLILLKTDRDGGAPWGGGGMMSDGAVMTNGVVRVLNLVYKLILNPWPSGLLSIL